ncbi:YchJ family protein [Terrabacter sp. GCM10028922]|uniref:YchJ family protein n=1 Tax=Terrabacter sp. GCM10028922 TaxID=3273428 RepID=UPI003623656E
MTGHTFGPGARGRCPCGSGEAYAACCGPLLAGEQAAGTAEELMRSRYSAFATGDAEYLARTWHPRTRPDDLVLDPAMRWTGLTVLRTVRGDADDDEGSVEFVATWVDSSARRGGRGAGGELHEVSRFVRRAGRWVYVDGDHG